MIVVSLPLNELFISTGERVQFCIVCCSLYYIHVFFFFYISLEWTNQTLSLDKTLYVFHVFNVGKGTTSESNPKL